MKILSLLFPFLFVLSACTPKDNSKPNYSERPTFEGDVSAKALEIYGQEQNLYSCDVKQKAMVLEVSQAIENQRADILKLIEKDNKDKASQNDMKFFELGGFQFYQAVLKKDSQDKWIEKTFNWGDIYKLFQMVREDKTNPLWIVINSAARALILDDDYRISFMRHPGLRRQNADRVRRIFSIVDQCNKNPNCYSLDLQNEDLLWINEGLWSSKAYAELFNPRLSFEERREWIRLLYDLMSESNDSYSFYKNPSFTVTDNELVVPMNLKVFDGDKEKVVQMLQEKWSQHGFKLRISLSDNSNAMEVVIKKTPGQRAHVLQNENKMVLFETVSVATFFHEFGHVLGLPDKYYSSFNNTNCNYTYELNSVDIMSNSSEGNVLPSHIEEIKKTYGIKNDDNSK